MIEPWMLQTGVPTVAIVALWVRFEMMAKSVEEIRQDVKRVNGTVREHEVKIRHLEYHRNVE